MIVRQNGLHRARAAQGAIIFVVALSLRLIAVQQLGDLPISRTPQLDSAIYLSWAKEIVGDPTFWPEYPEHAPGYPMFVALILALSNGSLVAVRVTQAVLGAVACVGTARVASRAIAPNAFLPAGLLQAAYAPLIYVETALLSEALLLFLLIVALDLVTAAKNDRLRWLLTGLALGAATIVRPTALAVLIAFVLVAFWSMKRKPAARLAGMLALGAAVVIAPVVMRNWTITGIPMVQGYGGMNFYIGNRPAGDGMARARPGGEWDALEGQASRGGAARNDQDMYYVRRTFTEIGDAPGSFLRMLMSKTVWTLQAEELRDTHSYHFFTAALPLLQWLPGFGVVVAFAVAGIVLSTNPHHRWLFAHLAATFLTVIVLVVGTRYRLPMVPALIAFAGGAIGLAIDRVRARRWRATAGIAALATVVWLLSHARSDAASRNLSEEWAMTGLSLLQEGKIEEAEAAYRTAIGMDDSSFAWDGLGLVMQRRELRNNAREAFERAVYINPANATAWLHLGLAYEFLGNPRAAVAAYQKALEIVPERAEAREMLETALRRYNPRL
jgi:4-amino-4-deoxy-L-arabinose transferase-like glycosyltransferase